MVGQVRRVERVGTRQVGIRPITSVDVPDVPDLPGYFTDTVHDTDAFSGG
jgi:hypothetical protein